MFATHLRQGCMHRHSQRSSHILAVGRSSPIPMCKRSFSLRLIPRNAGVQGQRTGHYSELKDSARRQWQWQGTWRLPGSCWVTSACSSGTCHPAALACQLLSHALRLPAMFLSNRAGAFLLAQQQYIPTCSTDEELPQLGWMLQLNEMKPRSMLGGDGRWIP